jgi:hypothetical protein
MTPSAAWNQPARQLHSARARRVRLLKRCLLWVPSGCAAFVMFFFPIATHMLHPCSHYLKHYRVPIPWTFTVFSSPGRSDEYAYVNVLLSRTGKARFGVTPFWDRGRVFSRMTFGSVGPKAPFEFNHGTTTSMREGATQISSGEFRLGGVILSCWQYLTPHRRWLPILLGHSYDGRPLWEVICETPLDVKTRDFYASFNGNFDDIPAFYAVLQGVTLSD